MGPNSVNLSYACVCVADNHELAVTVLAIIDKRVEKKEKEKWNYLGIGKNISIKIHFNYEIHLYVKLS